MAALRVALSARVRAMEVCFWLLICLLIPLHVC